MINNETEERIMIKEEKLGLINWDKEIREDYGEGEEEEVGDSAPHSPIPSLLYFIATRLIRNNTTTILYALLCHSACPRL